MARKPDSPPDIAARTLAALLHDILANGRKPLDAPDIADAVAVHDLRKTFKRWRAILGLIAPVIGGEAELMRVEARDLAREIATARDGRAALEALADLGDDIPTLSARSRATIGARLAEIGAKAEATRMNGKPCGGSTLSGTCVSSGFSLGASKRLRGNTKACSGAEMQASAAA